MRFPFFRIVAHVLGIVGLALLPPLASSIWYSEGMRTVCAFAVPASACLSLAALCMVKRNTDSVPINVLSLVFYCFCCSGDDQRTVGQHRNDSGDTADCVDISNNDCETITVNNKK